MVEVKNEVLIGDCWGCTTEYLCRMKYSQRLGVALHCLAVLGLIDKACLHISWLHWRRSSGKNQCGTDQSVVYIPLRLLCLCPWLWLSVPLAQWSVVVQAGLNWYKMVCNYMLGTENKIYKYLHIKIFLLSWEEVVHQIVNHLTLQLDRICYFKELNIRSSN